MVFLRKNFLRDALLQIDDNPVMNTEMAVYLKIHDIKFSWDWDRDKNLSWLEIMWQDKIFMQIDIKISVKDFIFYLFDKVNPNYFVNYKPNFFVCITNPVIDKIKEFAETFEEYRNFIKRLDDITITCSIFRNESEIFYIPIRYNDEIIRDKIIENMKKDNIDIGKMIGNYTINTDFLDYVATKVVFDRSDLFYYCGIA